MDERIIQFRVGVMVLATILITLILVFMFGDFHQIVYGTYEVRVWLREAPGVAADTPVRKSGLLIGRVKQVEFVDPDRDWQEVRQSLRVSEEEFYRGVIITIAIQEGKPIYKDEAARVGTSLLGDATIHVVRTRPSAPGPDGRPEAAVPPGTDTSADGIPRVTGGEWVRGEIAVDPIQTVRDLAPKLEDVMDSIQATSGTVSELAGTFNRLLHENEENLDQALGKAADALDAVEQFASNANKIFGDEQTQVDIRRAVERLPVILEDTHKAVVQMEHSMATFNRSLKNIEDFTEPLGRDAEQMATRVNSTLARLDQLSGELVQFAQAINQREGTLGQLIHNPEMYQNLNRTIRNVEHLTRKLEPIIDDARVFSDRVARNPGVIVRDAVRPGPGLK